LIIGVFLFHKKKRRVIRRVIPCSLVVDKFEREQQDFLLMALERTLIKKQVETNNKVLEIPKLDE
jgi:hypothetical protein